MSKSINLVGNGTFLLSTLDPAPNGLPFGAYQYDVNRFGCCLQKVELSGEAIRECNESQSRLFQVVSKFWAAAPRYKEMGVPHKSGVLLHGAPGTGKTAVLRKAIEITVACHGFALKLGDLDELLQAVEAVRSHYPAAPILIYQDDLDEGLCDSWEAELTHIMDGVGQDLDGCLLIGTTNKLDRFSDRLLRPGRFDHVVEISPPSEEDRKTYLSELWKVPFDHPAVVETARVTEGHVLAELRAIGIHRYVSGLENWTSGGPVLKPASTGREARNRDLKSQKQMFFDSLKAMAADASMAAAGRSN